MLAIIKAIPLLLSGLYLTMSSLLSVKIKEGWYGFSIPGSPVA